MPPSSTAAAALIFPSRISWCTLRRFFRSVAKSSTSPSSNGVLRNTTLSPASLNSLETAFLPSMTFTAKDTSVGGTCKSIKLPDMLSLPPTAGTSILFSTVLAPNSAAKGRPQSALALMPWKYSCNVRRMVSGFAPKATAFTSDCVTEYIAPWNGLQQATSGL